MAVATTSSACDDPLAPSPADELAANSAASGGNQPKGDEAGGFGNPRFRYVVTLDAGVSGDEVAASHGAAIHRRFSHVINGFSVNLTEQAAANMGADSRVRRVERDITFSIVSEQPGAPWGLDRIDQRSSDLDGLYAYDATGAGVTAYVVDTGIRYSHSEFEGRARLGYSYFGADGSDCHGHGTHVAGTIAGATYGVAKAAEVVSIQVLTCYGSGSLEGVVSGLDWVAANASGPSVVNMSLGGGASPTLDEAVVNLVNAGVSVVVAAGNSNADACAVSPAREPVAFTVGATDASDVRASWSNWGDCVDWFAPGVAIESASHESDTGSLFMSGTSMATPHAAGAVALLLEQNPTATPAAVEQMVKNRLTRNVVASANSPNADMLFTGAASQGSPPVADFTVECADLTCAFTDASTDVDNDLATWGWNFGDGNHSTETSPTHTYEAAGEYAVVLLVTDATGATGSVEHPVTVAAEEAGAPLADFTVECTALECVFTDGSTDADGTIESWNWDFGDGTASTEQNPTHTYESAGTFQVTLQVFDDAALGGLATQEVTVQDPDAQNLPPQAAFSYSCDGLDCAFSDESQDPDGQIAGWGWDFGDGIAAAEQSPAHTFSAPGTYDVALTVSDDRGATDTSVELVSVTVPAPIDLVVQAYRTKGRHNMDLTWSGATTTHVEIKMLSRPSSGEATLEFLIVDNTGAYTHTTTNRGQGEYTYQVCEPGTEVCSLEVTVDFY